MEELRNLERSGPTWENLPEFSGTTINTSGLWVNYVWDPLQGRMMTYNKTHSLYPYSQVVALKGDASRMPKSVSKVQMLPESGTSARRHSSLEQWIGSLGNSDGPESQDQIQ